MEWSKLKNIILVILVITNLVLLAFVASRRLQEARTQEQTRSQAILFLADRRVEVAEGLVPQRILLSPKTVHRDLEQESEAAARLLGGPVQVEARGAEVYRYFNDNGSVQFHSDGTFSAQLASGAYPVGENRAETCLSLLELLDFTGELTEEKGDALIFCQTWEGSPVFNHQVTLELKDGCVAAMTGGHRLVGRPEEDTGRTTITVATALIDFLNGLNTLGDVCSRIDGVEEGYAAAASLSGPMTLTPVWRITTDTGTYQLDLVNGELTRTASGGNPAAPAA